VTCFAPSERVIVPSADALTPPDPVGAALLVSGGQMLAHAPEQLDFPLLSATHRYSARPAASVRYVPADPLAVLIEAPVAAAFDAVEAPEAVELAEAAAAEVVAELEPVLLLPHPAAINATPRTAAAVTAGIFAFVRTVIRVLQFRGFL
jgi:hypothetical protein